MKNTLYKVVALTSINSKKIPKAAVIQQNTGKRMGEMLVQRCI